MALFDVVHAWICVIDAHSSLSGRVDDKASANVFGSFGSLAAYICHFLHAQCLHEQLTMTHTPVQQCPRLTPLGPITSNLHRTLAHVSTWNVIRISCNFSTRL